jgi:hypothetical protein
LRISLDELTIRANEWLVDGKEKIAVLNIKKDS